MKIALWIVVGFVGLFGLGVIVAPGFRDSGGSPKSKTLTGAAVRDCLTRNAAPGFVVSTAKDDLDFIAQNAGDSGIVVTSDKQEITLSVERSEGDAKATETQYKPFLAAFGGGKLQRLSNVVVVYSKSPLADESAMIQKCVG